MYIPSGSKSPRKRGILVAILLSCAFLSAGAFLLNRPSLKGIDGGGNQKWCAPMPRPGGLVVMVPIMVKNVSSRTITVKDVKTSSGKRVSDFYTIPVNSTDHAPIPSMGSHDWPQGGLRKHIEPGEEAMIALKLLPDGKPFTSTGFRVSATTPLGVTKSFTSGNYVAIGDDSLCD